MGRKKTITKLNEKYVVNAFVEAPIFDWKLSRLSYFINLATVSLMTLYFLGSLNMLDKLCTFIISGKVVGTNYSLNFSEVCLLSAAIVAAVLTKSTYSYLKVAKNRNKIKLRIQEAQPFTLSVRINA